MEALALVYGFFWGFLLCFTFGPAFFAIVQVSIDTSFRKGAVMGAGVVFADAILMFFAIFGTSLLPTISHIDQIISISGAALLLGMGLFSFFSNKKQLIYPTTRLGNFIYFFTKGAFLNMLNPANFLFVASTCTYLKGVLKYDINEIVLFFCASLLATLIAELLIAYYANKIKRLLDTKIINYFNKVSGSIFIIISLRILWRQFSVLII
ncbi:MAG: LysE family transporter [Bacteroidota bacterium]